MGRRVLALALVGSAASFGCYSPNIPPCSLTCADSACPAGLVCNGAGLCAEHREDVCDDAGACDWRTSNVDACANDAHTATAVLTTTTLDPEVIVNTSTLDATWASESVRLKSEPQAGVAAGGPEVAVLALKTLELRSRMTVVGHRPLVIFVASGPAIISGLIVVERDGEMQDNCEHAGVDGMSSSGSGSGGGGGSNGLNMQLTGGARGGSVFGMPGGAGGPLPESRVAAELSPLRRGCRGGHGGTDGSGMSGAGGPGGGAIQISARESILLSGAIEAPGGGGGAGASRQGAGGGGAGGSILLEAGFVQLDGRLCANGGGGGGASAAAGAGSPGTCDEMRGIGGSGASSGGDGATGANSAGAGEDAGAATDGGAGGGGGVGRIKIIGATDDGPSFFSSPKEARAELP